MQSSSRLENHTERHQRRVARGFLVAYWLHLPVFAGMALHSGRDSVGLALILGLIAVSGPTALYFAAAGGRLVPLAIAIGGMLLSGGLIHLGGGMIEMHFHVFVTLPLLAMFGRMSAIIAGAAAIAVHHVGLFFVRPESLFSYEAGFGIVVLHALFVIIATVPACYLAKLFGSYIIGAGSAVERLGHAGQGLKETSSELTEASTQLADDANRQAASVEEISASLQEIASQSQQCSSALQSARSEHAVRLRDAIGMIEQGGAEITGTMEGIAKSSEAITGIVKTIEEIAFQTNILALNAAVEAARAGEAGAGFAVVAGEVRTLAGRAADAARRTGELVEEAASSGREGKRVSDELATRVQTVIATFGEMEEVIANSARLISEQESGVSQINSAMSSVDGTAQAASAHAEELTSSAEHLRAMAGEVADALQAMQRAMGSSQSAPPQNTNLPKPPAPPHRGFGTRSRASQAYVTA